MFGEVGTYERKWTETDICINDHETRMDVPSALKMIASWTEVVSWGGGMISDCGDQGVSHRACKLGRIWGGGGVL